MLRDIDVLYWLYSLAEVEVDFHFAFVKMSGFHISNGVWDIVPDLRTNVRKTFS